jgi:hypothetical protein
MMIWNFLNQTTWQNQTHVNTQPITPFCNKHSTIPNFTYKSHQASLTQNKINSIFEMLLIIVCEDFKVKIEFSFLWWWLSYHFFLLKKLVSWKVIEKRYKKEIECIVKYWPKLQLKQIFWQSCTQVHIMTSCKKINNACTTLFIPPN